MIENQLYDHSLPTVDETNRQCKDKDVCALYDKILSINHGELESSPEITIANFVPLLTIVKFDSLTSSFQTYVNMFGIPLLRKLYSLLNKYLKAEASAFSMYDLYYLALIVKGLNKETSKPYSSLADKFWKDAAFQQATREGDPNYYGTVGFGGAKKGKAKKTIKKASVKKTSAKKPSAKK